MTEINDKKYKKLLATVSHYKLLSTTSVESNKRSEVLERLILRIASMTNFNRNTSVNLGCINLKLLLQNVKRFRHK